MEQNRKPRNGRSTLWSTHFDKAGKKDFPFLKESLLNKWCWENGAAACRMKLDQSLTADTKIDSKGMKDLNVKQESIKILEENAGSNVCDLSHSNFLLDTSPNARETKAKMNYWGFIDIKSFCTAKETVDKTRRQLIEWERIFASIQNL